MLFVDYGIRLEEFDEQLLDLLPKFCVLDADPRCGLDDGALEPELLFVVFDTPANVTTLTHVDWPLANVIEHVNPRFVGAFVVIVWVEILEIAETENLRLLGDLLSGFGRDGTRKRGLYFLASGVAEAACNAPFDIVNSRIRKPRTGCQFSDR